MGRAVVACFVEDFATESFVGALIERLASEESTSVSVRFLLARGGASVVKTRFEAYQRAQQKGLLVGGRPDLLVLVTDCDCRPLATCRAELEALVDDSVFAEHVIGAPTSHVEAWYLADGESFFEAVGAEPPPPPRKCAKDVHKKRLEEAVKAGGTHSQTVARNSGRTLSRRWTSAARLPRSPRLTCSFETSAWPLNVSIGSLRVRPWLVRRFEPAAQRVASTGPRFRHASAAHFCRADRSAAPQPQAQDAGATGMTLR
jgi:hypothetical protein